ncbi:MAG: hypothetical protein HZA49_04795 [Planctomycetes bacterium]|nr:hypothetical protein [Planctomycetota bacterium]
MKRVIITSLLMPFIFLIVAIVLVLPLALIDLTRISEAILSFCISALFLGSSAPFSYLQCRAGVEFYGLAPFLIILGIQITIAFIIGFVIKRSGQTHTTFQFIRKTALIYFLVCIPFGIALFFVTTDEYEYWPKNVVTVTTHVQPPGEKKDEFSESDASATPITRTKNSNQVKPFVIPGKIDMNEYVNAIGLPEVKNIEKLALDRINIIMHSFDRQKGVKANAWIDFSANHELASYTLWLFHARRYGSSYHIKFRKSGNDWIIIHDGANSSGGFNIDFLSDFGFTPDEQAKQKK